MTRPAPAQHTPIDADDTPDVWSEGWAAENCAFYPDCNEVGCLHTYPAEHWRSAAPALLADLAAARAENERLKADIERKDALGRTATEALEAVDTERTALRTALREADGALRGASLDLQKAAENLWKASQDIPDEADCANQASAARESALHYKAKAEDVAMVLA